ncbi:MAG TPA: alpha-amylase family glycosyl hydrolase [Myxococcales bacterium]
MSKPRPTLHHFRLHPARPAKWVHLKGDFVDWFKKHGMEPVGGGAFELPLELEPGVYAYKFHIDDSDYVLDPSNPRTEASGAGHQNSLLVVDGTEEPVIHAAARPCLFIDDSGSLVVRARLRRGAGEGMVLLLLGSEGEIRVPMSAAGADAEHLWFETGLDDAAGTSLRYLFEVTGPGSHSGKRCGRGTSCAPFLVPASAVPSLAPAHFAGRSIYRIVLDRFRSGSGPLSQVLSPAVEERCGGDLPGVLASIPHLADLGADALLLTPVALSPTYHRYDLFDPLALDPDLGTEQDLRAVVAAAHSRGMQVLFDCAVSHANPGFAPFRDVWEKGAASKYRDWFFIFRFPLEVDPKNPAYLHYPDGPHLPMLNTRNEEVLAYLERYVTRWTKLGIDGWRLDAVADVPRPAFERLAAAARKVNPAAVFLSELVPDGAPRYLGRPGEAVSDFPTSNAILGFFLRRAFGAETLADLLRRRCFFFGADLERMLLFLADLDQPRPLTVAQDPALVRLAAMFLYTAPGTPLLLYGDEVGLSCGRAEQAFEQGLDRVPMSWNESKWDHQTLRLVRALHWLRAEAPISGGGFQVLPSKGPLFAWSRSGADEEVVGLANVGDSPARVPFAEVGGGVPELELAEGSVHLEGDAVLLGPRSGALLRRALPGSAPVDPAARNLERTDRAFRRGSTGLARPSRFYLNLTERCNLRCAHCITCAPERTASGQARDMDPRVLDRLEPHLAHASYVGLVHAGEPTLAPLLKPMLERLRAARGGRPTVVHLLTNGMTLDEDRFVDLARLGVRSLSFSIDGVSPETNDRLRQGSRIEKLRALLPALVRVREAEKLDVRMGIAYTVTASNVLETPAAVKLAAQAGLDWIKLEEMYPLNALSQREAEISKATLARVLKASREVAKRSRILLLEHLESPVVRKCALDRGAAVQRFSLGDDFVNRMEINPCRLPFELICIEPDGAVKPLSFHHPAAGNLLEQDLVELWNSRLFRHVREQSVHERICGERGAHCPADPGPERW